MAALCPRLRNQRPSLSSHQCTDWRGWTHPHALTATHNTLFHLPTHHNDWTWHPSFHLTTGASTDSPSFQINSSPRKHYDSETVQPEMQISLQKAHPQHTIENRIAKAHSTLMISSTYPDPPPMTRSVKLSNPKNKIVTEDIPQTNCTRVDPPNLTYFRIQLLYI